MTYTVNIPLKLPSLNEYIRACRGNRYNGASMKKDAETQIAVFLRKVPAFTSPVTVDFRWIETDKRRDLDNVAFAKKFILDALVDNGIIPDDSPRFVKGFTDKFEYGEINAVNVIISEVEADLYPAELKKGV